MKNIDFITIKNFVEENLDFFIGARIQKIQQPTRKDFLFSLRNNGESRKLYVNINPQFYHITFASDENIALRGIIIPKHPPMFCMLLRKYLEGVKISDALAVENERIIEFHFETTDEFSQNRSLALVIELMGKHSNVILYDKETSIIIGCAHNVGAEKSRYRELQGGLKYIYPPPAENTVSIKNANFTTDEIDDFFAQIQQEHNLKTEKEKLLKITGAKLKKVKSSEDKISALLSKRDNTDKYKLYGDLLTANLYLKKDYSKKIEVFDYVHNENIVIDLDENKTLTENAQRYYKLYTKTKTTKEKSAQMLENLKTEREYLENILYSINSAISETELGEIKDELGIEDIIQKKKTQPIVEKLILNGFEVFIGKNNKQNDYIISKLAKDSDYWFHVHNCAGSHILLKSEEKEPDEATLLECCKLAKKYSTAALSPKAGVIYTKRKFLRKPPAAPLGYVTYKNEKEVVV